MTVGRERTDGRTNGQRSSLYSGRPEACTGRVGVGCGSHVGVAFLLFSRLCRSGSARVWVEAWKREVIPGGKFSRKQQTGLRAANVPPWHGAATLKGYKCDKKERERVVWGYGEQTERGRGGGKEVG